MNDRTETELNFDTFSNFQDPEMWEVEVEYFINENGGLDGTLVNHPQGRFMG